MPFYPYSAPSVGLTNRLPFKETIETMHDEIQYAKRRQIEAYVEARNKNPTASIQELHKIVKDDLWIADLKKIGKNVSKIDQPNPPPGPLQFYDHDYVQAQPQPQPQPQPMFANEQKSKSDSSPRSEANVKRNSAYRKGDKSPALQMEDEQATSLRRAGRQGADELQPLEQPRSRVGTNSGNKQQIRGQESVRTRSYHEGDKPHTKQHPLQHAPIKAQGTSPADNTKLLRQGSVKPRRQIADEGQYHKISGKEQAPRQLTVRPLSYYEADKQLHDAEVKLHRDPLLQRDGDVLSRKQQATHQFSDKTKADIERRYSVNVDTRVPVREVSGRHYYHENTVLDGDPRDGRPYYSYHVGDTTADHPGTNVDRPPKSVPDLTDSKVPNDPKPKVTPHHDPLLHPESKVLSPEQQATLQLGDETAADIKTSPPTDPNTKQMKLKWHQTRRGRCIIGFAVLAVIITLAALIGYYCFHKKVCDPLNVFGDKVSTVAMVPPKPRSTNLSSTVIFTKNDATESPIQVTVSRCEDDTCGENQQCKETSFGPSCNCSPGYDGVLCDDIDECEQSTHECSVDETCLNRDGGYECVPQQEKPRAPAPKRKNGIGVIILITLFATGAIVIVQMTVYLVNNRTKQTKKR